MDRYPVAKRTGTHADVLAAVGAADVLRHLDPRIVEFEDRFEVRLPRHLRPSDLDAVDPGFSYLLRPGKETPALPPERIVRTRAALAAERTAIPCATVAESRMYSILGRMKAFGGPNRVISSFAKLKREKWEAKIWEGFCGSRDFVCVSPLVQLFNPQSANGYALLKPSGTNRHDRTRNRWSEPFHEWLRFRGYFEGSAGWFASGSLRLFCPIPSDISHAQFVAAVARFRELRLGGTAVKMDCRAMLGLTRLLIEGAETYRRPRESVRGVSVTHYKDMGQAHTLMAMEQLAIPDWFELRTARQADAWLRTLEEHDVVLRRLNDSHSDELALLQLYRRTFQMRREESIGAFLEFLADYGTLVFRRRAENHWLLPQFTLQGAIGILGADGDLESMVGNPGFLAVAAAVRSATFGGQAGRSNGKPDYRETRYGLFSAIRRAALSGRRELINVVSEFVSSFNREAVNRRARGIASMEIQDGERDAFAALVERFPSHAAAGALLCGVAGCVRGDTVAVETEYATARAAWA